VSAVADPPARVLACDRDWTAEQLFAIERRGGDLMLDAGAGSGKTSVLVERFVRAVLEDGVGVGAILTITFTDKAAAEMRDRIRERLRMLGAGAQARATEGAFITTIHGFCARLLRTHALAAGIDPGFAVLDESESGRLAGAAFDDALDELAAQLPGGVELIASYGQGALRAAILATYAALRSRGELEPGLAPLAPAPDLDAARGALSIAAATAADELGALSEPSARVTQALQRLASCAEVSAKANPWPGDVEALCLPGGNGSALTTPACVAYGEALARFRRACEHRRAQHAHELLHRLLRSFGVRYAERKRARSWVDFEDLELLARELLRDHPELRERYRSRFARIMVDELQDTNAVQLELIESIADGNLFTVGDAQQSIYGFRHADVELFARRGRRLEQHGARASLQTNFRSRAELLAALNRAFAPALGDSFMALRAGRVQAPAPEPLVELLLADKGADWDSDGVASPWRVAEARALAARVGELVDHGASARDVVVLTRATTDLRVYERALEERGIATYVIGGRGYWCHPQVVDLVAYLRALANPRDEEAFYAVLASPLVGVSCDALVLIAEGSRALQCDPWRVVQEPDGCLEDLAGSDDAGRLAGFAAWFRAERYASARVGPEQLIERALACSGYDLSMLALPGGTRRLANVRKLMRLGREHEAAAGPDLRGFLELVAARAAGLSGARDARESEAPVEGEALDAVRLMTIHRAKGLEFEIVCVADLGRSPRRTAELLRVGCDGRFGVRLSEPGTGKSHPALDYKALGDEQLHAADREERRLFYVAMTRARERLIVSGAAQLDAWPERGSPIAWVGPAFVPEIAQLARARQSASDGSVLVRFVAPGQACELAPAGPSSTPQAAQPTALEPGSAVAAIAPDPEARGLEPESAAAAVKVPVQPSRLQPSGSPAPAGTPAAAVTRLSYSSLHEYARCGYRFYAERVLGLPPAGDYPGGPIPVVGEDGPAARALDRVTAQGAPAAGAGEGVTAADRGVLAHALLESLDFRRPQRPSPEAIAAAARRTELTVPGPADELAQLIGEFGASPLCARLARATDVRREERFSFLLARAPGPAEPASGADPRGVLVTGALDVLAREPAGRMLVVDYKSDRLDGADSAAVVAREYAIQQLLYAIAALRAGAAEVDVVHVFLERPLQPVSAVFTRADAPALERRLAAQTEQLLRGEFAVAQLPQRSLCAGCPAEGGLCSWPTELTRRDSPDRLF